MFGLKKKPKTIQTPIGQLDSAIIYRATTRKKKRPQVRRSDSSPSMSPGLGAAGQLENLPLGQETSCTADIKELSR